MGLMADQTSQKINDAEDKEIETFQSETQREKLKEMNRALLSCETTILVITLNENDLSPLIAYRDGQSG